MSSFMNGPGCFTQRKDCLPSLLSQQRRYPPQPRDECQSKSAVAATQNKESNGLRREGTPVKDPRHWCADQRTGEQKIADNENEKGQKERKRTIQSPTQQPYKTIVPPLEHQSSRTEEEAKQQRAKERQDFKMILVNGEKCLEGKKQRPERDPGKKTGFLCPKAWPSCLQPRHGTTPQRSS